MSEDLNPNRISIFRRINELLKNSKSLEEARKKYRDLVLELVLIDSPETD